jgi:hypothetical protein
MFIALHHSFTKQSTKRRKSTAIPRCDGSRYRKHNARRKKNSLPNSMTSWAYVVRRKMLSAGMERVVYDAWKCSFLYRMRFHLVACEGCSCHFMDGLFCRIVQMYETLSRNLHHLSSTSPMHLEDRWERVFKTAEAKIPEFREDGAPSHFCRRLTRLLNVDKDACVARTRDKRACCLTKAPNQSYCWFHLRKRETNQRLCQVAACVALSPYIRCSDVLEKILLARALRDRS